MSSSSVPNCFFYCTKDLVPRRCRGLESNQHLQEGNPLIGDDDTLPVVFYFCIEEVVCLDRRVPVEFAFASGVDKAQPLVSATLV